jgi:hypothetical protein
MAGTLTLSTLSDGTNSTSATNCILGSAKAWVNFDGTGTVTVRASYNVSSITDNGTGDYTINFTNALPDANYAPIIASQLDQTGGAGNATMGSGIYRTSDALSTSSFRFYAAFSTAGGQAQADMTTLAVSVFR